MVPASTAPARARPRRACIAATYVFQDRADVAGGAGLRPVAAQVCARSMPDTSELHRRSMAVSSLAGRPRPGWLGGNAVRLLVRCARAAWLSAWPAGYWRDRAAADRARGGGE